MDDYKLYFGAQPSSRIQCDQMVILFFQYLAIYNDENLPKSIQIAPKWVHNIAKYQINL